MSVTVTYGQAERAFRALAALQEYSGTGQDGLVLRIIGVYNVLESDVNALSQKRQELVDEYSVEGENDGDRVIPSDKVKEFNARVQNLLEEELVVSRSFTEKDFERMEGLKKFSGSGQEARWQTPPIGVLVAIFPLVVSGESKENER